MCVSDSQKFCSQGIYTVSEMTEDPKDNLVSVGYLYQHLPSKVTD